MLVLVVEEMGEVRGGLVEVDAAVAGKVISSSSSELKITFRLRLEPAWARGDMTGTRGDEDAGATGLPPILASSSSSQAIRFFFFFRRLLIGDGEALEGEENSTGDS